ncbi:hypothetical protein VHEMI08895 [[Torrubiella] hemipterigena]|uniref:Uncharacterized protein n=1 Tax=[Torrubiella] hemipterigena TaxID=1531966 RepID=A0A0A1T876_9HYPO|nr:hypothetical protein VHEMI08895 [[Torrubiella] hemipterigena]
MRWCVCSLQNRNAHDSDSLAAIMTVSLACPSPPEVTCCRNLVRTLSDELGFCEKPGETVTAASIHRSPAVGLAKVIAIPGLADRPPKRTLRNAQQLKKPRDSRCTADVRNFLRLGVTAHARRVIRNNTAGTRTTSVDSRPMQQAAAASFNAQLLYTQCNPIW